MTYKDKPEFIAERLKRWADEWELSASGRMAEEDEDGEEQTVDNPDFDPESFVDQLRQHGLPELKGLIAELQQMLKKAA